MDVAEASTAINHWPVLCCLSCSNFLRASWGETWQWHYGDFKNDTTLIRYETSYLSKKAPANLDKSAVAASLQINPAKRQVFKLSLTTLVPQDLGHLQLQMMAFHTFIRERSIPLIRHLDTATALNQVAKQNDLCHNPWIKMQILFMGSKSDHIEICFTNQFCEVHKICYFISWRPTTIFPNTHFCSSRSLWTCS